MRIARRRRRARGRRPTSRRWRGRTWRGRRRVASGGLRGAHVRRGERHGQALLAVCMGWIVTWTCGTFCDATAASGCLGEGEERRKRRRSRACVGRRGAGERARGGAGKCCGAGGAIRWRRGCARVDVRSHSHAHLPEERAVCVRDSLGIRARAPRRRVHALPHADPGKVNGIGAEHVVRHTKEPNEPKLILARSPRDYV